MTHTDLGGGRVTAHQTPRMVWREQGLSGCVGGAVGGAVRLIVSVPSGQTGCSRPGPRLLRLHECSCQKVQEPSSSRSRNLSDGRLRPASGQVQEVPLKGLHVTRWSRVSDPAGTGRVNDDRCVISPSNPSGAVCGRWVPPSGCFRPSQTCRHQLWCAQICCYDNQGESLRCC